MIRRVAERAVLVRFGSAIDAEANARALRFLSLLDLQKHDAIVDAAPGF